MAGYIKTSETELISVNRVRPVSDSSGIVFTKEDGVTPVINVNTANGLLSFSTANYENLVIADNDIPNKKYVDSMVSTGVLHSQDIVGLKIANNATDSEKDIDFITTSNAIWCDSTMTILMKPTAGTITKQLDANWAEGTNQGGLDTGTITIHTYYYMYAIRNSAGNVDYLFSLSATSPTLPSGYIYFRRIRGYLYSDGATKIIPFLDNGDGNFVFKTRLNVFGFGSIASTSRVLVNAQWLPPNFIGNFICTMRISSYNQGMKSIMVGDTNELDMVPTTGNSDLNGATNSYNDSWYLSIVKDIKVDSSGKIYYRSSSNSNVQLLINLIGYTDKALL